MRDDLIELEVLGVRRQSHADQVVVLLLDVVGRKLLPIVVGLAEGSSIVAGQSGLVPPRPMTHDLLVSALASAEVALEQVEIVALVDGVFHAALVLDNGTRVDSRASDAIAVAVRTGCPVLCRTQVLEASGLEVEEHSPEEEVEQFRAFLDTVSPDDFMAGDDPDEGPSSPS